ncbi:mannose-1-phosphate guanylyltransferase / mannose-6-phosphate isomerase [Erythrobacter sp. HL-111]|nr:MAG: mannose-1-phosphate guanylyltransferase / mannose-6-phosphate isomerase [Erythrobacteraceae bacterium HL-111]SDS98401.1 mannose-1-phosphate guanylyltransferase / mannose-6-phosphate isomerase [Erythrobacter sp. HL-111]
MRGRLGAGIDRARCYSSDPMSAPARIHPVILCGGSGTRLWPVSRKARPKPFLPLVGSRTLFEAAQDRVGDCESFAAPIIVAGAQHCELIEAQARGQHRLVIEPAAKNTAPAIALAAALLPAEAVMLVCPSDHHIADETAFVAAALAAASLAREDWLVSFGIAPDHPETGYGYLRRGEPLPGGYRIARFVEKPDLATAQSYLATGEYSWNGGIFAFRAGHFLDELARHRPDMARLVGEAVAGGREEGTRFHPAAEPFAAIEGDSVDYAVMENTDRAAMVPADMGWSDIGNWAALADALAAEPGLADPDRNVARGPADLDSCRGVLALSDGPRVSVVGLEDICVVVCEGEVLVTTRAGAQRVGKLPGAVNQEPAR